MTVGIFRSRIFTAGRAFLRDGRGVSAVETAFAFPVILAAFFIIVEFANMALTIQVGESAVSSALLRFRDACFALFHADGDSALSHRTQASYRVGLRCLDQRAAEQ